MECDSLIFNLNLNIKIPQQTLNPFFKKLTLKKLYKMCHFEYAAPLG